MRFTGVGRDRKYEIRNTESKPMSNVQGRYNVPGRDTKFEIRNTKLQPMSKVQGRYNVPGTKYKVEIRIGIEVLEFKGLDTWYFVLRTTFSVLLLDTSYLFPIPGGISLPIAALAPPILFICFIILRMSSNCFIKLLTSVMFLPEPSASRFLRLPSMISGF